MISKKLISTIFLSFLIQSCSFNNLNDYLKKTDCANSNQEVKIRQNLFHPIPSKELKRRRNIKLPSISALEDESVFSKIINAIKFKR